MNSLRRAVAGGDLGGVVVGVAVLADDVAVVEHVVTRAVEAGHHTYARQALREVAEDSGDPVAHTVVALVGRATEPQRQDRSSRAR